MEPGIETSWMLVLVRLQSDQSVLRKATRSAFSLVSKSDSETLIVKIHDVIERRRRSVMKIWCARCERVKDRTFHFADIGAFAAD